MKNETDNMVSSVSRMFLLVACAMMATSSAIAGLHDTVVRFSTTGMDRYADGTVVIDGECYALVWSPKGAAFSGFNADGTPVSEADKVVLAGSLASGGRCRDAMFQIPEAEYAELSGGEWAVCLVDTRNALGLPTGVSEEGVPRRVNRWGVVQDAGVKIAPASISALMAPAAGKSSSRTLLSSGDSADEEGVRADTISAVPPTAKRPKITYFTVDGGVARLKVEDTEPYLTYGIASGESPSSLNADGDAGIADGKPGAEIEFEADASGGSRFFKVIRAE